MRFPIASKLIFLIVLFLVITAGILAMNSSKLFEAVLIQREEYSNLTQASSKATEIESILNSLVERVQIVGSMMLKSQSMQNTNNLSNSQNSTNLSNSPKLNSQTAAATPDASSFPSNVLTENKDDAHFNFNKDKNLVSIDILKVEAKGYKLIYRQLKKDFYAPYKQDYISFLREQQKFPVLSVAQKNIEIQNACLPKGPSLITIGVPLSKDDLGNVTHIALADVQWSLFQKPFSERSERVLYMVDRRGVLLAHKEEHKALAQLNMSSSPLVEKALKDSTPQRQIQFTDPDDDQLYIGAYSKNAALGITVISQTDKEIILEPAREVKRKAYFISGQVISVAIFVIFIFSLFLTGPIEKLAELIPQVSKGNFDLHARNFVKSHDEVGDLALAFDKMTEGLKERDKVKNLFSKFHGSSIAEDLIKNDISVGGQNKEVTVFFSDIRGFTAFSEKRTPEEVVDMLNEYFSVMVSIINKNQGVVDKFIGDAIMAVWGAPKKSLKDTENAVKACLEMRTALVELNEKRKNRGHSPIMIGIGLHCGRAISGTIGSQERMEYTVIGDTVNVTSRIEASTKAFGADLLVSQFVVEKVKDQYQFELAGSAEVKGKSEPLKLYKVRGYKTETGQWIESKTEYSDYEAVDAEKVKVSH